MIVPKDGYAQESFDECPAGQPSHPAVIRGTEKSLAPRLRTFFGSGSEGGALVEFAVTLPVVLLLITGIFTFSVALYQKLMLAEAVSDGGRTLAVARGDNDPCQETAARIYQSVQPGLNISGLTLKLTIDGNGATGGTYTISGGSTGAACAGTTAMGTQGGGTATLSAQYTCSLAVYGYTFPGCSLGTQITEVIQ
jgi:Flp pilus assembly protein TadG